MATEMERREDHDRRSELLKNGNCCECRMLRERDNEAMVVRVDAGGTQDCEGGFALRLLARVAEDSTNRWPGTNLVLPLAAHFPGAFRFCAFPRVKSPRDIYPFYRAVGYRSIAMLTNEQGGRTGCLQPQTPIAVGQGI